MFLTGEPAYPVERTVLVTGVLDALLESKHQGGVRLDTPQLHVPYQPPASPGFRPAAATPQGASLLEDAAWKVDYAPEGGGTQIRAFQGETDRGFRGLT